ncbi:MAG TPA: PAS domain S-box protein [Polyangiales bacterium]|nr:PAS domain S-box protein [Polyangiales bacterium]
MPGDISAEEVLHALLRAAPVRVGAIDRAGRFLLDPDPNPPRETDPGAPPGKTIFELYGGSIPGMLESIRDAFAGQSPEIIRTVNGAKYLTSFVPRRSDSGEIDAIFIVGTVVTDGGQTEQHALMELQARERGIFNLGMVGLIYWEANGAVTDANDTFLQMVGYTRADLVQGKLAWTSMTPPQFRHLDQRGLEQIKAVGHCVPFEKQYIHKDGHCIDVLIGGSSWWPSATGGVAFVVDITERKRDEVMRKEAEDTLRKVVAATPIVLWSVNQSGIFTLSTGRGLKALGLTPGQVVGQSVFDVYADVPSIRASIRRCLEGEELNDTFEAGGRVFDSMLTPLTGAQGHVNGVLGISIDITERRRAENEQELLKAQLLQAQKLESLGLLAGGIAHDFNNILTPILGAASAALMSIPKDNPAYTDIELVIVGARRAASLTRQMLAYSGKAQVEIHPIDLSKHVHEIAGLLQTTVSKKVQLRLELAPGLPAIEADVAQLQQIVMNLVINAAEAIGEQSGSVIVSSGTQRLDRTTVGPLLAAEALREGDFVFVQVNDTGHGMDEATIAKIFDPFYTTKFHGRGLGLAAVLGIVRAHRGAIEVQSSPGLGSSFKIFFPRAEVPAAVEPTRTFGEFRGDGLVLVIDDDPGVRLVARRMLKHLGFEVVEAEDGEVGARVFRERAEDVVLVLLDMTMPKLNGEETLLAIRRIRTDVPVIVTSGYNESEASRRFVSQGLAGFLEKPFTSADLTSKVHAALTSQPRVREG